MYPDMALVLYLYMYIFINVQVKGCQEKIALSDLWRTARLSFQIALYSLVKHRENLMLHQKSLRALYPPPVKNRNYDVFHYVHHHQWFSTSVNLATSGYWPLKQRIMVLNGWQQSGTQSPLSLWSWDGRRVWLGQNWLADHVTTVSVKCI